MTPLRPLWHAPVAAALALPAALLVTCCAANGARPAPGGGASTEMQMQREQMVATQIEALGIKDPLVLKAMREVPRHVFVPEQLTQHAYEDRPLPIGEAQTISQPYIVALMTELARVQPASKVLEVGTGSGYQAAVLAALGAQVYTIEIIPVLAERARADLETLGYRDIQYRVGDGYRGWPEAAPFDAVIVTAAPDHVPQPLVDQLKVGGRLVIPVGDRLQRLMVITRTAEGVRTEEITPVRFVPMTGEAQRVP